MSDFTVHPRLPRLREIFADGFDIAQEANAHLTAQLSERRQQVDKQVGAFCPHAELPNPEPGPLAGLPITIKDQFHLAGTRVGFGFGQLGHGASQHDAPALAALRQNGAHFIGRTNMPPLALDFQAVDGAGYRTNNPHEVRCTTGGSSGGGAAAVATGMSLIDIGADLSGSLRIPASFCGVMSLLPSDGQFSNKGMLLDEQATLPHFARPGLLGRCVDDLWIGYRMMQGDVDIPENLPQREAQSIKLGWLPQGQAHPLERKMSAVFDHWQKRASRKGVQFGHVDMDLFAAPRRHDFAFLMGYETGGLMPWTARLAARIFGRDAAKRSPDFLTHVQSGYGRSKKAYKATLQLRENYIADTIAAFGDLDAIVTPVTPMSAFEHVAPTHDHNGIRDYDHLFCVDHHSLSYFDGLTYYTGAISLLGFPVVTLPIGFTSKGLPVGAQLIGRPHEEAALLAVAARLASG